MIIARSRKAISFKYKFHKRLVYPTGETVNPKYWQTDKSKSDFQRATNTKKIREYSELNSRLDNIEGTTKDLFRRFVNDHKKQPSVELLRILELDLYLGLLN